MSVRFCRECGARMSETDKFCFNCGTPASPPPRPVAPVDPDPVPVAPVIVPQIPEQAPVAPIPMAEEPVPANEPATFEEPQAPEVAPAPAVPAEPSYVPPVYTAPAQPSYVPPVYTAPAQPPYTPPVYTAPVDPFADLALPQEPEAPAQPPKAPKAPKAPKPPKAPKEQKVSAPPKPLPKRKVLNVLGCVLICILLVALILPTVLLVDVRLLADEEKVMGVLERVDLDAMPAKDIFVDITDDSTMLDWACDYTNHIFSSAYPYTWEDIRPKALQNFLEDTSFLELTADTVAGLLTDVIEDTSRTSLDAGDIEDFLLENSEFLEEEFDLFLNWEGREKLADQTMKNLKMDEISLDAMPDATGNVLTVATSALSMVTLILLGVLIALLIVLLFLVSRKYIMAGIHDTGLVFLISGIVLLALTGAARLMVSLSAGKNAILYTVGILAGSLLESGLLISVCIFAFGLLLLLISGITLTVLKKRAAK